MSKPSSSSTLYRLIEAGQLAHQALMVPLRDRGLEPGDDAVLFVLGRSGLTEAELSAQVGLGGEAFEQRVARLIEREVLVRQAVGPDLVPGIALSPRGERIRALLIAHWEQLEEALMGELDKKHRKRLGKMLKRFVDLLRL